ncbi:MAG: hypothetical protein DRQ40_09500 [Gammaproteobacteria bacterium]|nr:MAG: hypothetical protein DRQ40_09500 [Gammaproteobacteria bacterium]
MALIFTEGFDAYGDPSASYIEPADIAARRGWLYLSGSIPAKEGRINGTSVANFGPQKPRFLGSNTESTTVMGIAYMFAKAEALGGSYPIVIREDADVQLSVVLNSSGKLEVRRGTTTTLATGTTVIKLKRWYYIELKSTIHQTTGSFELRIDGKTELSETGTDTQATSNAYANVFGFSSTNTAVDSHRVDDMYVLDSTGTYNNDFLGPIHIETLFPDEDVTSQWSPSSGTDHYALVDENPCDNDTTYLEDNVTGQRELFDWPALPPSAMTIVAVTSIVDSRVTDASSVDLKLVNVSGTTTTVGTAQTVASESFSCYEEMYEENPDSSSAWTKASLEAAKFGFEVG